MSITLTLIASLSLALAAQDHQHNDKHNHAMNQSGHEEAAAAFTTRTITVAVNGMVCDFCARSLTKVLERNDAVETVDVSLEDKNITILLREGGVMSDEDIDQAVRNAGYNIASIDRSSS